jgi:pimeloyl-ACP methyl ester carboxylesterase
VRIATAAQERPVRIPFEDSVLAGVLTSPLGAPTGTGVIVFHGGGDFNLPSHRNRWTTTTARRLAGLGHHVIRVGYRGVGDSTGRLDPHTQERPLVDQAAAVARFLTEVPGVDRIVFVGSCFGARSALGAAALVEQTAGLILSSMSIADQQRRHAHVQPASALVRRAVGKDGRAALRNRARRRRYARIALRFLQVRARRVRHRLLGGPPEDAAPWVSETVMKPLETLVSRRVPVKLVYGRGDEFYQEYVDALAGRFGVLARQGVTLDDSIHRRLHGFPSVAVQEAFADVVCGSVGTMTSGGVST